MNRPLRSPAPARPKPPRPVHSLKTEDGTFVQVEPGPLYHTLACMNAERGNVDDNTPEGNPGEDSSCICRVGLRSWVEIEEAPE